MNKFLDKLFNFLDKVNEYIAKIFSFIGQTIIGIFGLAFAGGVALLFIGIAILLVVLLFNAVGLGFTIVIILLLLIFFRD